MVAQGVETTGRDYLNDLQVSSRVTWVDRDGTVLYDNQADPAQMENHADREEIQQALTGESGTARRFSATLSQQTLYAARRLSDGTVIRMASAQQTVVTLLLSMIQPILIILALALILVTAPFMGPGLNGLIWFFTYRFTVWPIAVVLPLFGALGILIPVLSCRAAQRYSVVERLRQE